MRAIDVQGRLPACAVRGKLDFKAVVYEILLHRYPSIPALPARMEPVPLPGA